jgi:superfamily I DNA/RNA helicase
LNRISTVFPSQHTKWTQLLALDSLNPQRVSEILKALHLDRDSVLFKADLYRRFRTFLAPPTHTLDQGHDLIYTPEQRQLAVSKAEGKKIAGVAGAGKTYVLAKRAVNAYVRTRRPVLVLTFNITLKNYIHDRISEVRETFDWANFYITNYHRFFATKANHYELPCSFSDDENNSSFNDEGFFEPVARQIAKFPAIFIDEVQDYKIEWLQIVKKYFLAEGGEYVLFGDEKQNLYRRPLESKAIRTNIHGPFARMKTSQRLNTRLAEVATKFQAEFFKPRHEVEIIQSVRQQGLFEPRVEYRCCNGADSQQLIQMIMSYLNRWGVHPNDASILCSRNEDVRQLDSVVRGSWRQHTTICCETQEEFDAIARIIPDRRLRSRALRNIQRSRRYNFWANAGKMKLCTVHSFKGWECSTIFLIIDEQRFDDDVNDELIYTALTRCRDNLVVISLGKNRYHDFFAREIGVFAS